MAVANIGWARAFFRGCRILLQMGIASLRAPGLETRVGIRLGFGRTVVELVILAGLPTTGNVDGCCIVPRLRPVPWLDDDQK